MHTRTHGLGGGGSYENPYALCLPEDTQEEGHNKWGWEKPPAKPKPHEKPRRVTI